MTDKFKLHMQSASVCEIIATEGEDEWVGEDVETIGDEVISEMTKNDKSPFFVEFIGLHEGGSRGSFKNFYTADAVKSCAKAMLGVNMYKGHEQPGSESWAYREPVAKVVASRLTHVEVGGERVLAAKGKAYISEADPKLRSDIRSKMAGPVSILGDARITRDLANGRRTVNHVHAPLKSIDFCNPGTNGMAACGVTSIVQEIISTEDEDTKPKDTQMKLTREQLLADYGNEIKAIVAEQVGDQVTEVAEAQKELKTAQAELKTKQGEFDTKIAEMKADFDKEKKRADDAENALAEEVEKRVGSELRAYALEKVKEMADSEDHDEKIVEMAAEDIEPQIVDGDLDKSKTAFDERLNKAVERCAKIFEMAGGKTTDASDTKKKSHKGNKTSESKNDTLKRLMNKDLAATL